MSHRWISEDLARAVAAVAMLPSLVGAQTIRGALTSAQSHHRVREARLSMIDERGHVVARGRSDGVTGGFSLSAPKPGRYQVKIVMERGGVSFGPLSTLDSGQVIDEELIVPEFPPAMLKAYLADDVTKPARIAPGEGTPAPRYPWRMRDAHRVGLVRATIVVEPSGRADTSTFRVVSSDDDLFATAVRKYLAQARFVPAQLKNRSVPQLYELAVLFDIADSVSRPDRPVPDGAMIVTAGPAGKPLP